METSSTSQTRWWDLPSAIFLFLAVLFSALRMQSSGWTDELEHVRNIAIFGNLLGLALGYSLFKKRGVIWLSIGYMLVIFFWQWLGALNFDAEQTGLQQQALILGGRILINFREVLSGKPVTDPLFFIFVLSLPYWFTALTAGYQLTRHNNIIAATIPTGILMIVVHISDAVAQDRSWLIALFLFMCVLLAGRRSFLQNRHVWKTNHVQVTQENNIDISTITIICAALLIITAWVIPTSIPYSDYAKDTWREATRFWHDNEFFEDAFAAAKKTAPAKPEKFRDVLQLGTSISQSQNITFIVYVPARAKSLPRLYWRGRIYDQFIGGRWSTSKTAVIRYNPQSEDIKVTTAEGQVDLRFSFSVYEDQFTIYSPAQPVWVNQPVQASQIRTSNQEYVDVLNITTSKALDAGDTYDVRARVSDPTIEQLSASNGPYPSWVTERYLQLPQDFSARIRELANEITANAETPYAKTVAITNYLRTEIKYSPSFQLPNAETDALEYFLFTAKSGFCNYYATAEVLMLRAVGIPARLAVGFAQGESDTLGNYYTVRDLNAHSWPEVYFSSYGWVEFEPTGNQNALERPERREATFNPVARPTPRGEGEDLNQLQEIEPQDIQDQNITQNTVNRSVMIGLIILITLSAVLLIRVKRQSSSISFPSIVKNALENNGWKSPAWLNNWVRWSELTSLEYSFQSINYGLRRLGLAQPIDTTPSDRAAKLINVLPRAQTAIETVTREHQSALFTAKPGDEKKARRSAIRIIFETLRARIRIFIMGYN